MFNFFRFYNYLENWFIIRLTTFELNFAQQRLNSRLLKCHDSSLRDKLFIIIFRTAKLLSLMYVNKSYVRT